MGCGASKAKPKMSGVPLPKIKHDPVADNKILTDAGLAPITEPQLELFNEFLIGGF